MPMHDLSHTEIVFVSYIHSNTVIISWLNNNDPPPPTPPDQRLIKDGISGSVIIIIYVCTYLSIIRCD